MVHSGLDYPVYNLPTLYPLKKYIREDLILTPTSPTPEFLSKDFSPEPGLEWKVLLWRTWATTAPTAIWRTSLPSLSETWFP